MLVKAYLPNDPGAGDMDLMVSTTNELVTTVAAHARSTKGVVDQFGVGYVLVSWNVAKRAVMSQAVVAANKIVRDLAEPFALEGVKVCVPRRMRGIGAQ